MGNIALAVFFGLKNTPLALLSPFSYDGLNLLHLIVGYTAVAQMVFHGICYMKWEDMHQAWSKLLEPENWGNRCGICHVGSHDGVPQTFWIRDLLHQPHHRLHPNTCFRGIARTLLGREDLHSKSIYRLHLDHRPLDPGMEIFNFVDNRATLTKWRREADIDKTACVGGPRFTLLRLDPECSTIRDASFHYSIQHEFWSRAYYEVSQWLHQSSL